MKGPFRNIQLKPDDKIYVEKTRVGSVPTLILRPSHKPSIDVGLLWIHGGGYITGMKEMVFMSRATELVRKYGISVISPGYRLAWLHPFPAAFEDCFKVLQYMDQNRKELNMNTIMIGGESAGGGLAIATSMMARDQGIDVAYQFPLYPMINNLDTESSKNNHGRIWNTRHNHFGWSLYLRGDRKKTVSPFAAPSHQKNFSQLPPCYTFVGNGEPFYCETLEYVKNLRNAGVSAEVDVYPTDYHAFDMLKPEEEISRLAALKFEKHFERVLNEIRQGK